MKNLIFLIGLFSMQTYSMASTKDFRAMHCSSKKASHTFTLQSEVMDSGLVKARVSMVSFSINPDGTSRIVEDIEDAVEPMVFNSDTDFLSYVKKGDFILLNSPNLVSFRKKTFTVRNDEGRVLNVMKCKDIQN